MDDVLLAWADEIVCMEEKQAEELEKRTDKTIICLGISDDFPFRDPELVERIAKNYDRALVELELTRDDAAAVSEVS